MFGYIYKTTNLLNGKIYIGQHQSNKFDTNYYGSGKLILEAINKYGIDNFKCELIEECESKESLNKKEIFYINKYKSKVTYGNYNISDGGNGGNLGDEVNIKIAKTRMSPEFKEKMRPIYESNEYKEKVSHKKEENPMWGKSHTEESVTKISEALTGIHRSDDFKKHRSEYMTGKHWYNNGIEEHYYKSNDIPVGYIPGRLKRKSKNQFSEKEQILGDIKAQLGVDSFKGLKKHVYNNGIFEIITPICPDGFVEGRLPEHLSKIGEKNKGKIISEETRKKISRGVSGEKNGMYGVHRFGKLNPNYGHYKNKED